MYLRTLLFGSLCLVSLGGSAALAVEPIPIEGTILVTANDDTHGTYAYFMEGSSDNVTLAPGLFTYGDISPFMDRVTYSIRDDWPATWSDVWAANIDGSEAVNLTALAGLGGVSCKPVWSPDGQKITFHHADLHDDLIPCQAGWHVWVINADGTGARRVTPSGAAPTYNPTWSPNGYRLTCVMAGVGAIAIDDDGTDLTLLPNVADQADWSPDGSKIASVAMREGTDAGKTGVWREVVLTSADGADPQVVVQRFLSDSDVADHLAIHGPSLPDSVDPVDCVREGVGPSRPRWSPLGDRILFRAALPFDPVGPMYGRQVELWLYEVGTAELTRLTEDEVCEFSHSWNGPNTFPEDPEVTVDDVTVTFSEVSEAGVTTIVRDDDPPDVPTGLVFDYEFYELNTSAEVTGPITICMTYTDEDVPEGPAEDGLAILHYDEQEQIWEDITTSHDTVTNVICGQTDTLSAVAFYGVRRTQFPDVPAWGFGADGLDPHWAYYQIMACVEARIVAGYQDGTYQPTSAVTRDQMAVYIARALAGGDENVPSCGCPPTFPDVDAEHWALDYVEYAVDENVVAGYDDGSYHPEHQVNRAQMAVYITRARGWVSVDDDMTTAPEVFPDVPAGYWAGTAVQACADNGVAQGYLDGNYYPDNIVTRDQMAVYVARAFELTM